MEIGVIFKNVSKDDYQALKKYLSFETPHLIPHPIAWSVKASSPCMKPS